jgi:hypothetical protein
MMLAVAVVAISLGGWVWLVEMKRRSAYYSDLADAYALEADNHTGLVSYYLDKAKSYPRSTAGRNYYPDFSLVTSNHRVKLPLGRRADEPQAVPRLVAPNPELHAEVMRAKSARERVRADYFGRLGAKYRRAARYPWLSAEPDPVEPK